MLTQPLVFQDGKSAPRSLSKILKRKPDEEVAGSQKSRKVSSSQAASKAGEGRQSTGGKSLKGLGEDQSKKPDASKASKGGMPPRAASGAAAAEGSLNPQSNPQGTDLFGSETGLPMRVKTYSQQPSGGSSGSRRSIGAAYAGYSRNLPCAADSPRWPNFQRLSKSMLKTVSKEEEEAIPGIQTFDADRIATLLSEVKQLTSFFLSFYAGCLSYHFHVFRPW